jgi:predicted metal-dependent peptidase
MTRATRYSDLSLDSAYRKRDRALTKLLAVVEKEKAGSVDEDEVNKAIDELALAQITLTFIHFG